MTKALERELNRIAIYAQLSWQQVRKVNRRLGLAPWPMCETLALHAALKARDPFFSEQPVHSKLGLSIIDQIIVREFVLQHTMSITT